MVSESCEERGPSGLLETAACPESFLGLCSDRNWGLKVEKMRQGNFRLFLGDTILSISFFGRCGQWCRWGRCIPAVAARPGVVAELQKRLMRRSQGQSGNQSVLRLNHWWGEKINMNSASRQYLLFLC